ncbi:MFS transporter [Sulfobacillus thermosulfidooxidans]|uniref:MFS transporter n=1 Tax=Sulfobacillus thermosulfidooxidans TaxID=28034 RepID=UPI0002F1E840|nr:MFS transporter [Sulfobacillus thermosulfidooxidans]
MAAKKYAVLAVTSLGALLSALNFSTLIIALPDLIRSLSISLLSAMWIMMAYMVSQTVMVLMAGSLADHFGRRRLYILGMLIFTMVSLTAGFVHSALWLITLRVLQGMGGAMLMANSAAIVADWFEPHELGRALGINVMVVAVGQIIGPVLGGWLTTDYGWQWTFWFNVPFGIIAVLFAVKVLGLSFQGTKTGSHAFDMVGVASYILAVSGLLIALTWGAIKYWDQWEVYLGFVAFVIFMPVFLWNESHAKDPILHLSLFKNRTFGFGNISAALLAISRMAILFLLIFYFQGPEGDSALKAGILSIPLAAGMLVFAPISGWMADSFGALLPTTLGTVLTVVGLVGLGLDIQVHTPYWQLALWMIIAGIGSGLFNSPNTSNIMNAAGVHRRGEASGIRSLTTNTGMLISVAFSLVLVTQSIPKPAMLAIFAGTVRGIPHYQAKGSITGFIHGLHLAFLVMAFIAVLATILSVLRADSLRPHGSRSLDSIKQPRL